MGPVVDSGQSRPGRWGLMTRTHCPRGHELGWGNVTMRDAIQGFRRCRECSLERSRLVDDAAWALGLSRSEYRLIYGTKRATAEAILESSTDTGSG